MITIMVPNTGVGRQGASLGVEGLHTKNVMYREDTKNVMYREVFTSA